MGKNQFPGWGSCVEPGTILPQFLLKIRLTFAALCALVARAQLSPNLWRLVKGWYPSCPSLRVRDVEGDVFSNPPQLFWSRIAGGSARQEAAAPLLLARTAALWLARDAASTAFAFFMASGRAL